jgi:hypothetical protein
VTISNRCGSVQSEFIVAHVRPASDGYFAKYPNRVRLRLSGFELRSIGGWSGLDNPPQRGPISEIEIPVRPWSFFIFVEKVSDQTKDFTLGQSQSGERERI